MSRTNYHATIRPVGPRVVIRMLPEPEKIGSGILYRPDQAHEDAIGYGIVEAVGYHRPKKSIEKIPESDIKPGDKVAFIKFMREVHTQQGIMARIGKDRLILEFKDLLGVVDD